MTHFIADAIRAHVDNGAFLTDSDRALLAVLDECERLRATNSVLGHALGFEFEGAIARELGITTEETSC